MMSRCDLARFYKSLTETIAMLDSGKGFIFSPEVLPTPETQLITDQLYIRRSHHNYNSYYRADKLCIAANKPTYCNLGLLILSVVFQPDLSRVELVLTHPWSEIKQLLVEFVTPHRETLVPGYSLRPYAFSYYPQPVHRYPWVLHSVDVGDLPCFFLTNYEQCIVSEQEWQNRDTVVGFGSGTGSVRLAAFLLNISRSDHDGVEYDLEGEAGYRGVGVQSAEATFFTLPE